MKGFINNKIVENLTEDLLKPKYRFRTRPKG